MDCLGLMDETRRLQLALADRVVHPDLAPVEEPALEGIRMGKRAPPKGSKDFAPATQLRKTKSSFLSAICYNFSLQKQSLVAPLNQLNATLFSGTQSMVARLQSALLS